LAKEALSRKQNGDEERGGRQMAESGKRERGLRPIHSLLLVPFAAMLAVPFYNRAGPELAGIPFFYWYQLLWIPLGALLLLPVYRAENRAKRNGR